jgi:hypothetical protein
MMEYAILDDLTNNDQVILEHRRPDASVLSVTTKFDQAEVELTVYDAIVLRQGLDEFIAQAVGAYV